MFNSLFVTVVTPPCSRLSSTVFVFLPLFVIAKICFHLQGPNTSPLGSLHNHEVMVVLSMALLLADIIFASKSLFPLCYSKEKASGSEENTIREGIEK